MALKNSGIPSYTWATKPAIANWPANRPIIITDVGLYPTMWWHNGVNWRPVNGSFILAKYAGSVTNPIATLTGVAASKFTLSGGDPTIPANLLIPGSSVITAEMRMRKPSATATVFGAIRMGTAGTTADQIIGQEQLGAGANADQRLKGSVMIDTSTRALFDNLMTDDSMVGANGWTDTTTNINTAAAMYVIPHVHSGNVADNYSLLGFEVVVKV